MASASPPPPLNAMDTGHALMEVMRETAVSFSCFRELAGSCSQTAVNISLTIIYYICAASCQSGAFQCSNGQCIRSSDRCDGPFDCTDGSDENGCCKLILTFVNIYPSSRCITQLKIRN